VFSLEDQVFCLTIRFPRSILVIGARNSGKTSFIDFLRTSLASNDRRREKTPSPPSTALPPESPFSPQYLETEVDHERIGVTLWDSQGLEKKFVDLQLREMSSFLESKFEETFTEEQKVVRAPGVRDTHIHCVFLILDPSRLDANLGQARKQSQSSPSNRFDDPLQLLGVLDEDLDVQVLRTLQGKTTVIPVISKADTITANHMTMLKRAVWDSLKQAKLDPLEALTLGEDDDDEDRLDERDEDDALREEEADERDDDDDDLIDHLIDRSDADPAEDVANIMPKPRPAQPHRRSPSGLSARLSQAALSEGDSDTPYLPLSIISPDSYEPGVIGRRFPWGFADPYNKQHCDFVRLKESVFSEWRAELREASREVWYEGWRTSRLKRRGNTSAGGKGTIANGSRGASHSTAVNNVASPSSLYGGGPVGHAGNIAMRSPGSASGYSSPMQSPPVPGQGNALAADSSPEMIKGMYRQGVNAF
jgi:septin family protein